MICVIVILIILRMILGSRVRYYYISNAGYDDQMLMEYSHISKHFHQPNCLSMVKTMSYPLLISVIYHLHISFSTALSLVWVAAALLFCKLMQDIFHHPLFSLFGFAYVLFHPVAYEATVGLRIYRNTLIAPFVFMTFCELFQICFHAFDHQEKTVFKIIRTIFFSLLLLYTYYIKEDGLWILACVLFFFLILLAVSLAKTLKKKESAGNFLISAICISLPLCTLYGGTVFYKSLNQKYFGVAEIQTRTEGELGEFVSNLYQIDSPEQTCIYTVPAESITAVYNLSPTFQKYPELYDSIMHSKIYNYDITKNPIQGDFMTWVLRSSLVDTGVWQNEKQVSDLFEQINDEVEDAFRTGKLKKNHKIQLLSSAVGRTPEEIKSIFPYIPQNFYTIITLKDYSADVTGHGTAENMEAAADAAERTELSYLTDDSFLQEESYSKMVQMVNAVVWIYRIINVCMCVCALYALVYGIATYRRRKKNDSRTCFEKHGWTVFTGVMMFCISIAYSFSIIWFAQFCITSDTAAISVFNFYTTALVPLLAFSGFMITGSRFLTDRDGKH